jgi:tripartite-type tricarboxylate transporter receptor subunit TctC
MRLPQPAALARLIACSLACLAMAPAAAQPFPNRPVKLMVGYLAGGGVDITARHLAESLREGLGQTILVENRAGASGMLAAQAVAKAAPDGYTLLLAASGEIATNPHLYKQKMQYDALKDLLPVTNVVMMPNVLVVNADVPASNVAELLAYAKSRPGKLNFSSSGIGNPLHLAGELFNKMGGVDIVHVPYKGAAQQTADVAAKHITMTFASVAVAQPFIAAGTVKALAVSSKTRVSALPNVPAVTETPAMAGYQLVNWYGLFAPAGTPPEVTTKLNAEVTRVLRKPEFVAKMRALGGEADPMTPPQFRDFVQAESANFKRIIEEAKVTLPE